MRRRRATSLALLDDEMNRYVGYVRDAMMMQNKEICERVVVSIVRE